MKPIVVRCSGTTPNSPEFARAVRTVADGGLIVFPTETVYGIGADVHRPEAIARIYRLKRRPIGLPLLIHCGAVEQLDGIVDSLSESARLLIGRFWPGPLTLILPATAHLPPALLGPDRTVGVRMVDQPATRDFISALGSPLAGTSANRHGDKPTGSFAGIAADIIGGVDCALNGGACGSGTPSTVIALTASKPKLIRAGAVPTELIEEALGRTIAGRPD